MVEEPVKLARANFSPCTAEEQQKQQMQAHPAVLTSRAQIWRATPVSLMLLHLTPMVVSSTSHVTEGLKEQTTILGLPVSCCAAADRGS